MRGLFVGAALLAVPAGLLTLGAVLAAPDRRTEVLDGYLLFLGAVVLVTLVRATRASLPAEERSAFERALQLRPPDREPVPELARLEREVGLASSTAFDLHARLRPTLREIAAHRLSFGHGIELDTEPARARGILGEPLWAIVDPNREPPSYRHAPGLPPAEIRALVDALEKI